MDNIKVIQKKIQFVEIMLIIYNLLIAEQSEDSDISKFICKFI